MFRGTDLVWPDDFDDHSHRVGGSNNGYTGRDQTTYVQELPNNQFELALWLEAERLQKTPGRPAWGFSVRES